MDDIVRLMQQDGIPLQFVASTNGGEYAGPCLKCGGEDRFRVWPADGPSGRWWCRRCQCKGDGIQYLRDKRGMSYAQAVRVFGMDARAGSRKRRTGQSEWKPDYKELPNNQWLQQAGSFASWFQESLVENLPVLEWLARRGITQEAAMRSGLGWNSKDLRLNQQAWGLADNGKSLWIPAGLVIPCCYDELVVRLRIRRWEGEPRYVIVSGGSSRPMITGRGDAILLVESELDAILLTQLAGDIVRVVAMGSAQARPDAVTHEIISKAPIVLNAFDSDESGAKEALNWWVPTYKGRVKRWPVPDGKDPGDAYALGCDLRAWVQAGLDS